MSGALAATAENLTVFAMDPTDYVGNPAQFSVDLTCTPTATLAVTPGTTCTATPAGNGSFSQNVQRLGFYAENSWRVTPQPYRELRRALRHHVWTFQRLGPHAGTEPGVPHAPGFANPSE